MRGISVDSRLETHKLNVCQGNLRFHDNNEDSEKAYENIKE